MSLNPEQIAAIEREQQRLIWNEIARLRRAAAQRSDPRERGKSAQKRATAYADSIPYAELRARMTKAG